MARFSSDVVVGAIGGVLLGASVATIGKVGASEWEVQKNVSFVVGREDLGAMLKTVQKHVGGGKVQRFYCSAVSERGERKAYPCRAAVKRTVTSLRELEGADVVLTPKGVKP
jgi:hypothetical protein